MTSEGQPIRVAVDAMGGDYAPEEIVAGSVAGKEIVDGKHDDIPEQAFYMVGTIDEVLEKAESMKTGA